LIFSNGQPWSPGEYVALASTEGRSHSSQQSKVLSILPYARNHIRHTGRGKSDYTAPPCHRRRSESSSPSSTTSSHTRAQLYEIIGKARIGRRLAAKQACFFGFTFFPVVSFLLDQESPPERIRSIRIAREPPRFSPLSPHETWRFRFILHPARTPV